MENRRLVGIIFLMMGVLIWQIDVKEWRLLRRKGNLVYPFKKHGRDLYPLAGVYLVMAVFYNINYIRSEVYTQLWHVICWDFLTIIMLLRCNRKYGIYEDIVVIRNGCYKKEDIVSFHWAHYVQKSEVDALMLEIPAGRLFKGKKRTMVEVEILKEDTTKLEKILQEYSIKKQVTGDNTLNKTSQ